MSFPTKTIAAAVLLSLALPTWEQSVQPVPASPCPNVFTYESSSSEPLRWYGVVNLSTDITLHSLWLNVVLDNKADILGNWIGDVTTGDNLDFKIENTQMKIQPGPATPVRFFVQYSPLGKVPRVKAIRLNGREICKAISTTTDSTRNRTITAVNPDMRTEEPSRTRRPEERPSRRPPSSSETEDRPIRRPSPDGSTYSQDPNPYSIGGGDSPAQTLGQNRPDDSNRPVSPVSPIFGTGPFDVMSPDPTDTFGRPSRPTTSFGLTTSAYPMRVTTQPPNDDFYDPVSSSPPNPDEYFDGRQPTIVVDGSINNNANNQQGICGTVAVDANPLVINGKPTLEGQWPWQIALYQTQTVDNKYICGGTLVTHRHVITAAHCVTRKSSNRVVNKNTLTVYLGKHNLRTSVDGVQIRLVGDIIVHPEYNASSFSRDLAILQLREPVQYTKWVRPACLWPENEVELSNVVGKKGSVVGWGFDASGLATEELTLVEMPVVDTETCIYSYSEFFARFTSQYTYCAGFRDGTSVCNGDSGGGMVFNSNNVWFLRGLVSLSVARQNEYRCDPSHYVVFTDLAKFLPWIKQHIFDY